MRIRPISVTLALLLGSIASFAQFQAEKALIDVPEIEESKRVQADIDANSDKEAPANTNWYVVIKGSAPIIVTAPHATRPYREGSYRFADGGGTAALAKLLNSLSCVTIVYTQYESPSDPNYYDDNAFKQAIASLIKEQKPALLID